MTPRRACPADTRADFLQDLETREDIGWLRAALANLPAPERDALRLRYDDDLTYQEAAETLQLPLTTIWRRVERAEEHLRQRLSSERRRA